MSSDTDVPNTVQGKPAEEKATPNRANRRYMAHVMSKPVQPVLYGCGTCKLPFIGKVRCQCKPEVKLKKAIAEYIENRINDEVLVSPIRSIPEVV